MNDVDTQAVGRAVLSLSEAAFAEGFHAAFRELSQLMDGTSRPLLTATECWERSSIRKRVQDAVGIAT